MNLLHTWKQAQCHHGYPNITIILLQKLFGIIHSIVWSFEAMATNLTNQLNFTNLSFTGEQVVFQAERVS